MTKLLVLDFETTGPDPETCMPLELGARFYEIPDDGATPKRGKPFSQLIWENHYPEITPEITRLTGITTEMARKGTAVDVVLPMFEPMINKADVLVAYNAKFDRRVLHRMFEPFGKHYPDKPWFCGRADLPYPENMLTCQKLQHRALDLGLPMDGREQHRAMADVDTLCDIMDMWDMRAVLDWWRLPWLFVKANIPGPWIDGGKGKDAAKAKGFGWECAPGTDEPRFEKSWVKRVKHFDPEEYSFPVTLLRTR